MNLQWTDAGWADYWYWQKENRKTLKRTTDLIKDVNRNGFTSIGKPEPLEGNWSDYWNRRIDEKTVWFIRLMQELSRLHSATPIMATNKSHRPPHRQAFYCLKLILCIQDNSYPTLRGLYSPRPQKSSARRHFFSSHNRAKRAALLAPRRDFPQAAKSPAHIPAHDTQAQYCS